MAYYKVTTEDQVEHKIIANHIHDLKRIIIEIAAPIEEVKEITHKEFHGNNNNTD